MDYSRFNRFGVFPVSGVEKPKSYFVTNDEMLDVLHD